MKNMLFHVFFCFDGKFEIISAGSRWLKYRCLGKKWQCTHCAYKCIFDLLKYTRIFALFYYFLTECGLRISAWPKLRKSPAGVWKAIMVYFSDVVSGTVPGACYGNNKNEYLLHQYWIRKQKYGTWIYIINTLITRVYISYLKYHKMWIN